MKLKQVIQKLKEKDIERDVHFMVLGTDGEIIAMSLEGKDLMGLFKELGKLYPKGKK